VLDLPRLYAIVDVEVSARAGWQAVDLARAYLSGGVRLLQIRAKTLESGALLDLADAVVALADAAGARVIVNDRADIAALAGAAGVHVGQDDLSPVDVRRVVPAGHLVGLSTHTEAQVEMALTAPIDYLAIGPIFATGTKNTGYEAVGLSAVGDARRRAGGGRPVVAIGGITLAEAPRVIEAGAASVAVITDLVTADPESRVRRFLTALA
jgi:thiamine-phosphate pyrophosphorylase